MAVKSFSFWDSESSSELTEGLFESGYRQVSIDVPPPGTFSANVSPDGGVRVNINEGEEVKGRLLWMLGPVGKLRHRGRWDSIIGAALRMDNFDVVVCDIENKEDAHRLCVCARSTEGITAFRRDKRIWIVKDHL